MAFNILSLLKRIRASKKPVIPQNQFTKKDILSPSVRLRLYGQLETFLTSAEQLDTALEHMYEVYSNKGREPRNKLALVVREVLAYLSEGKGFAAGLNNFVPEGEFFLLTAGEAAGNLAIAFRQCIRSIKTSQRIKAAKREAYANTIWLFTSLAAFLVMTSYVLVPQALLLMEGKRLTGLGWAIYMMSEIVTYAGIWIVLGLILIRHAFEKSKDRYIGHWRIWLDRHWPYATHRMIQGTIFLISLCSLRTAKITTGDALDMLAENASRYMQQRLIATRNAYSEGVSLGDALAIAGYEFPDREAIIHLRIIGTREGAEAAINEFADNWLTTSVERLEAHAKILHIAGIILIVVLTLLVFLGLFDIQTQARATLGV